MGKTEKNYMQKLKSKRKFDFFCRALSNTIDPIPFPPPLSYSALTDSPELLSSPETASYLKNDALRQAVDS